MDLQWYPSMTRKDKQAVQTERIDIPLTVRNDLELSAVDLVRFRNHGSSSNRSLKPTTSQRHFFDVDLR
jgi:hypothetical protein